ncbi:hypothetical protein OSB04_009593 [Centaurea solstitialis]|uniref:ABC-2 type transporter transmembrane domain-containing protein n=1 Tax=Centaurea solstitialis TaxID=347529 RepID=A0AA38T7K8_9ASTR|nr:hypothetical protein OSB04_009593 [Centaurea solstitialis]
MKFCVPFELEDKVHIGSPGRETSNAKPSPAIVREYLVEACVANFAKDTKRRLTITTAVDQDDNSSAQSMKREWGSSWGEQYSILFRRGIKERQHDYFSWLRITQVIATTIILGLLWWQSKVHSPKDLQDQTGLLFFIAVFWAFFPVLTAFFTFPQERAMLKKERASDMYKLTAYFMARTTSDLPLDLFLPLLFLLIVYFMNVPIFISWLRSLSFNYHTYRLILKVQYETISSIIDGIELDNGLKEVVALVAMVLGYRILAYLSL